MVSEVRWAHFLRSCICGCFEHSDGYQDCSLTACAPAYWGAVDQVVAMDGRLVPFVAYKDFRSVRFLLKQEPYCDMTDPPFEDNR